MSDIHYKDSPFELIISFKKYFDVLEHIRYNDRLEYRVSYAESLIDSTKNFQELRDGFIDPEVLTKNEGLIKVLLADLFPTGLTKNEIKAASAPLANITFNYTERFKKIVQDAGTDFNIEITGIDDDEFYIFCCCLIIQTYFDRNISTSLPFHYDIPNKNKIMKHYKITVNSDFTEIYPNENTILPSIEVIDHLLQNMDDVSLWKKHFPLKSWILKGFSIISLVDITTEVSLSKLKSTLIEIDPQDLKVHGSLSEIFKSFFDVGELNFGLMTFNKVNNKLEKLPVYDNFFSHHILDFWINLFDEKLKKIALENVKYNPKPIVVSNVDLLPEDVKKLTSYQKLKENNINSFMIIPILKDDELLAIMEFTSPIPDALNGLKLKKVDFISDMILYSLSRFQFEKNNQIEAIIQRDYTSIHHSVYWKFRNEAERKYNAFLGKKNYSLKEITFKDVYPLFGEIDIRSSSDKRRICMTSDVKNQLSDLLEILVYISRDESLSFQEELKFYRNEVLTDLKADTEYRLYHFLEDKIHYFLKEFKEKSPGNLKEKIEIYFSKLHHGTHFYYHERKKLDDSIAETNLMFAEILDEEQKKAQKIFPHYYERFKSDGLDHSLFVGQSISPSFKFSSSIVKKLRFWQLKTQCKMEKQFHFLKNKLAMPFEVTSLILAYNEKIDIRFRMDEKKFDVDGAYFSYYEIIKKRLDKSYIKNSKERLTTPGKITIVYFNKEDETEYLKHIKKLQDKGYLTNEIEFLEVDNLQGVIGLLALRVSLNF